jgi:hypothetical protein
VPLFVVVVATSHVVVFALIIVVDLNVMHPFMSPVARS